MVYELNRAGTMGNGIAPAYAVARVPVGMAGRKTRRGMGGC